MITTIAKLLHLPFIDTVKEFKRICQNGGTCIDEDTVKPIVIELRQEYDRLRKEHERHLAQMGRDAAITEAWLIQCIDEDLKRRGLPTIQFTDGGGSECPTGWHRRPYIP